MPMPAWTKEGPGDMLLADLIKQTQDYFGYYAPIEEALYSSITATRTTAIGDDLERTRGAVMDASRNVQAWLTGLLTGLA